MSRIYIMYQILLKNDINLTTFWLRIFSVVMIAEHDLIPIENN